MTIGDLDLWMPAIVLGLGAIVYLLTRSDDRKNLGPANSSAPFLHACP